MLFIICLLLRDTTFSYWHLKGSTKLHNKLFYRVLRAPLLFFLRTPVGDILNAFAKDQVSHTPTHVHNRCSPFVPIPGLCAAASCSPATLRRKLNLLSLRWRSQSSSPCPYPNPSPQDTLDETLPDTLHMSFIYLMTLLTSLGIVTASLYPYAALTAALFGAFAIMQQVYLPAATILKRWAGETASMVFVHVDESLHGMEVIKAFDAENYFLQVRSLRSVCRLLPDLPCSMV